jgi:hypothetical protein
MATIQKNYTEHYRMILFVATIYILESTEGWLKVVVGITWALLVMLLRYLTPIKESLENRK